MAFHCAQAERIFQTENFNYFDQLRFPALPLPSLSLLSLSLLPLSLFSTLYLLSLPLFPSLTPTFPACSLYSIVSRFVSLSLLETCVKRN